MLKGKTTRFLNTTARAAKIAAKHKSEEPNADVEMEAQVNPFWEVVRNLEILNVASSVYEAKAGVRPAVVATQVAEDLSDILKKNKTIKGHIKKATQTMRSTGSPCVGSPIDPGTPKCKSILKIIGKQLD